MKNYNFHGVGSELGGEVWREYGGGVEEVWRRCGGGVEEVWRSCGGGAEEVWRRCYHSDAKP